jgi:hypothetical protein
MALAVVCASTTVIAGEQVRPHRGSPARPSIEQSSEARIQQVPERSRSPAQPIPEGEAKSANVRGPSAPVTCNGQNSESPACYTATQQSRPVTR